ncbi:MAG: PqqD family protein [Dehalococcoidia bacterium]
MATLFPGATGKPLAKDTVEEREIDRELCLFDAKNSENPVHILNSGAALVWYLCDGEHEVESIASQIAITFAEPYDQVLADVRETVHQFQSLGLLQLK